MWYLCVFYHRLLDYRKPEVESLAQLFGAFDEDSQSTSLEWRLPEDHHPDSPFHFVNLPSEEVARNVANRSKLVFPFLAVKDLFFLLNQFLILATRSFLLCGFLNFFNLFDRK